MSDYTENIQISGSKDGVGWNSVATNGGPASVGYDLAAAVNMLQGSQDVATAADSALVLGAVTHPYRLFVKNRSADSGNILKLSYATGGSFAASVFEEIPPGKRYLGHPKSATVYAKFETADGGIFKVAHEIEIA